MRISKILVLVTAIISLLAIAVASQLAPIAKSIVKTSQITPNIALEEKDICTTEFYDETQDVYGNCVYYNNYTSCLNTSGLNTDCSPQQSTSSFKCKTGENIVTKNKTECRPDDKFVISVDDGAAVLKKQIDFSDWGPCVFSEENNCLIVTCQSIYDGANDGKFHSCKSGTSCQRFEICDGSTKTLYKNSRADFVENDPTFKLEKLALVEVAK
jgi:hypothetical protein